MKRRLLSAALVLALCAGLCVPALAMDIKNATREDVKSTYTILRNGTVDETKGTYASGKRAWLDSYAQGAGYVVYHVYDENDSWTITNTGSKTISADGNMEYTISFSYCSYGGDPSVTGEPMTEIGGSGMLGLDDNGNPCFIYGDPPAHPVVLKAGQSITIPASAFGSGSPKESISELLISINYGGRNSVSYFFYFGYDPAEKAAIEKNSPDNKPAPSFTDTPSWCAKEAQWAVREGITNGAGSDTIFAPATQCTHDQILTFLWRAEGKPAAAQAPVTAASYYQDAVNWAYEKGFIDDSFQPTAPCTRAQAVSYIWQARNKPQAGKTASFTDVAADAPYTAAVNWAVEKEVTNGYGSDDTFAPDRPCGRGEIVVFLYRAYN